MFLWPKYDLVMMTDLLIEIAKLYSIHINYVFELFKNISGEYAVQSWTNYFFVFKS